MSSGTVLHNEISSIFIGRITSLATLRTACMCTHLEDFVIDDWMATAEAVCGGMSAASAA